MGYEVIAWLAVVEYLQILKVRVGKGQEGLCRGGRGVVWKIAVLRLSRAYRFLLQKAH